MNTKYGSVVELLSARLVPRPSCKRDWNPKAFAVRENLPQAAKLPRDKWLVQNKSNFSEKVEVKVKVKSGFTFLTASTAFKYLFASRNPAALLFSF